MYNWILFGLILIAIAFVLILLRRIYILKETIESILQQVSILKVNDRLQKRRIESQLESIIEILATNSHLKARITSLQKEVKALTQLLNN